MRILKDYSCELETLEERLKSQSDGGSPLKVLEAGCGREWHLRPGGVALRITGVDLDETALHHRQHEKKDLDEAILGDLRTVDLPAETFDVVYCSFVLEHVEGAAAALDNMVRSLKPGGLLIVRVPDLQGVQTFLARRLPRWAAIAYYRFAWKIRQAGQPGFAPYPTFYDPVISREGFQFYCAANGLEITDELGVGSYRTRGSGPLSRVVPIVAKLIARATGGRVHDRYVDLSFVARKQAAGPADATASSAGNVQTKTRAAQAESAKLCPDTP